MAQIVTSYSVLLIFALAPSIVWLLYFLRKDPHPEPRREIVRIFFYGAIIALPAALIEIGILDLFAMALSATILIALTEEVLKYLVVREKTLKNPEFNEPADAMIYMISSALGFAALENILILFSLAPVFLVQDALYLSAARFIGATLLHTLVSGLIGFCLAISFFKMAKGKFWVLLGIITASALHALYNFSIISTDGNLQFVIPGIVLMVLTIIISLCFQKLKELAVDLFASKSTR